MILSYSLKTCFFLNLQYQYSNSKSTSACHVYLDYLYCIHADINITTTGILYVRNISQVMPNQGIEEENTRKCNVGKQYYILSVIHLSSDQYSESVSVSVKQSAVSTHIQTSNDTGPLGLKLPNTTETNFLHLKQNKVRQVDIIIIVNRLEAVYF